MTASQFRALLDWWMCSDPFPIAMDKHDDIESWLNDLCKHRGFDGWVDAYHEFKVTA